MNKAAEQAAALDNFMARMRSRGKVPDSKETTPATTPQSARGAANPFEGDGAKGKDHFKALGEQQEVDALNAQLKELVSIERA